MFDVHSESKENSYYSGLKGDSDWLIGDIMQGMKTFHGGTLINQRRNFFAEEFKYLTGIDLKKEVKRIQEKKLRISHYRATANA
jgi:hypothetical protein